MKKILLLLLIVVLIPVVVYAELKLSQTEYSILATPTITGTATIPVISTTASTGTYSHTIKSSSGEGLSGEDLRIGLDETLRALIISDKGDIDVDHGLAAQADPTLIIFNAADNDASYLTATSLSLGALGGNYAYVRGPLGLRFIYGSDVALSPVFQFTQGSTDKELTASNIVQDFMILSPEILHTSTAGYNILRINPTISSVGSGVKRMLSIESGSNTLLSVNNVGHVNVDDAVTASFPVISTCGGTPVLVAGSNDHAGKVTIGTGATTACTVTFGTAYANTPSCIVMPGSAVTLYLSAESSSAFTVTSSGDMTGTTINYHCIGVNE